mgnify:CR=1 FL=1
MRALGIGLTLILWSVVGACTINELNEWRRERMERGKKGNWVVWLAVNGRIARLR